MILDPEVLSGGHRWRRCSSCGREAITLNEGERCRQTAAIAKVNQEGTVRWSCPGKLHAPDAPAGKGEGVCQREGCGHRAAIATALGERVCLRCLGALVQHGVQPGPRDA